LRNILRKILTGLILRVRLNNFSSLVSLWLRYKLTPAPPMLNIHIGTAPFGTTQATWQTVDQASQDSRSSFVLPRNDLPIIDSFFYWFLWFSLYVFFFPFHSIHDWKNYIIKLKKISLIRVCISKKIKNTTQAYSSWIRCIFKKKINIGCTLGVFRMWCYSLRLITLVWWAISIRRIHTISQGIFHGIICLLRN